MGGRLSKNALGILEIIFEKLRANITPDALNMLLVMSEIIPKRLFEEVIKQLSLRVNRNNTAIIDKNDIQDVTRTILFDLKTPSKIRTGVAASSISELLGRSIKEKETHRQEIKANQKVVAIQRDYGLPEENKHRSETQNEYEKRVAELGLNQLIKHAEKAPNLKSEVHAAWGGLEEKSNTALSKESQKAATDASIIERAEKPPDSEKLDSIRTSVNIIKAVSWYRLSDSPEAFRAYFASRYEKLRRILEKQIGGRILDGTSLKPGDYRDSYVILLVDSKEVAKNGKGGLIAGDDMHSRFKVYVPFDADPDLKTKFDRVLEDTVIAVEVKAIKPEKFIIASNIIFPDMPRVRTRNKAIKPTKVLAMGDIHVGSKQFMKERFEQLIKFLRGDTDNSELNQLADEIEYVILVGDLADGIGVYPQQRDELAIFDQKSQYRVLAEYLSKIPDDKLVIAIPGNHDASTRLIPQPPISEKFAEDLYNLPTVQILSNPAMVEIRGVKILLYHGQGLERIAGLLGVKLENIHEVTTELLRWRHLCPQWGSIPQAPTQEDYLVVEEEPDVLIMGHVHICSQGRYRGTAVITVGSFEGLTAWQRDMGIIPTVGYFDIIDLQTYELVVAEATEKGIEVVKKQKI